MTFSNTHQTLECILSIHLEWSRYLDSSASNLYSRCQSHEIRNSPKLKVCWTNLLNEEAPKTRFTQMIISSSFILTLPELLTVVRIEFFIKWFRFSFSCTEKKTNGFNLVLSTLTAILHWPYIFLAHLSSNKQILLLAYRL